MLDLSGNSIERIPPLALALAALAELILDENALRTLGDELLGLPRLKKLSARSNRIAAVDPGTGQQVRVGVYGWVYREWWVSTIGTAHLYCFACACVADVVFL